MYPDEPRPTPRKLLGIWAHPDDEAYLTAGLMDRVVRTGGDVTLVALTDGEAGFDPDDPRPVEVRRRLRRDELRTATAAVGVHDVRHLGLPDGGVALADRTTVADALTSVIDEVAPDVVVTFGPDGITGHGDHVACSDLATMAWLAYPSGELWYATKTTAWLDEWRDLHDTYGVWMTEEPPGADPTRLARHLDLTGRDLDRKRAALAGHASQTAGLADALGESAYRRWIAQESFRWAEPIELAAHAATMHEVRS